MVIPSTERMATAMKKKMKDLVMIIGGLGVERSFDLKCLSGLILLMCLNTNQTHTCNREWNRCVA